MAPSDDLPTTTGAATYLIHHVVLPPKLPQQDDYKAAHEQYLIVTVICALRDLRDCVKDQNMKNLVTSAITTITNLDDSRDTDGNVSESLLSKVLHKLAVATSDEQVPLEIKAQNAGLLISRRGDFIDFEPFELSPVNKKAMGTVGRLVRTFPGSASRIPVSIMQDKDFRKSLAYTIAKLTTQTAPGMQPQVRKEGQFHNEDRDTTHPTMVSDWLMNYIAAFGGLTDTVRITKNTREEVLWHDCRHPWRRSPLWLLIRVTLQLLFARASATTQSLHGLYKVFMAQLLLRILQSVQEKWKDLGSEILYVICAKLERRIRKMEQLEHLSLVHPHWVEEFKASMVDAHAFIDKKWTALTGCDRANIDTASLSEMHAEGALDTSLPELDGFLASIAARRQDTACTDFRPSDEYATYTQSDLPKTLGASGDTRYLHLAALEAWVEQHLGSWLTSHVSKVESCGQLYALMQLYHSAASTEYTGIPASLSVMYLTLVELWVACDKSACSLYSLLPDFDPELVLDEFQCLILPHHSHMQRLAKVERYLDGRRNKAIKGSPPVFHNFGNPSTFAVKYFNTSRALQTTLLAIEQDAAEQQKLKREELAGLKLQYKSLMDHYNNNICDTQEVVYNRRYGYTETRHSTSCRRCASKSRADNLEIGIYEWPLSSDKPTAKATVFELQVPQAFSDWRDASMYLIATVLGYATNNPEKPQCEYTLDKHHELSGMLPPQYYKRRIVPLSSIKPHTGTHRKITKAIPTVENHNVCLPNALEYGYYDKSLRSLTGARDSTEYVAKKCLYRMPDARSKTLERFLYRPPSGPDGRTPNEVVASLFDCPVHFSIDEYKGFGSVPSGRNIIYSNILTQLAIPTIDFAKVETHTLCLQVIGQCGASNGLPSRISHSILLDESFCRAMLAQLELSLRRVSENWESWRAVAAFVALSLRILSLTLSKDLQNRSLNFLARARHISAEWLTRLQGRARISIDEKQRTDLYSRATEVALLCTQTFNVEDEFIDVCLQQSSAISTLLQCSIVVQENHKVAQSESQAVYKAMLQSWRMLLYRAFSKIRQNILQGDHGLHAAVRENWADFSPVPGAHWNILSQTYEHWLYIKSGKLTVYFNLLTAELLVNGLPLARLPSEFMQHPTYMPLFGKSTLEVVPTDYPGMKFSAKSTYQDNKLHFGMTSTDMLVVAVKNNSTSDLVPSRLFHDRLPLNFVTSYIHWYDHDRDEVLFCSRDDPWSNDGTGWRLIREGSSWRLVKDVRVLVNICSSTARKLSTTFGALESPQHIHTVLDTKTRTVHISLPRLQLDFHIDHHDNQIQSRQYRGMIVDPIQTMRTLVGLTSKLVLTPSTVVEDRMVLIPVPRTFNAHSVRCVKVPGNHHVSVSINQDEAQAVFAYSLDNTLARVLESGDVQRRLFLALLHALTSHCLPDPLTGYTGTESALKILQSAAVRSFEYLSAENVEVLHEVAALSPLRSFYPSHLKDMQKIKWDPRLPFLSQHSMLRTCAEDIIRQAETMRVYYPDHMPETTNWKSSNTHLEARDMIRTSTFRVYSFGANPQTACKDASYEARDLFTQSQRGQRAYIAAALIMRDEAALHTNIRDLNGSMLQNHFKGGVIKGSSDSFDSSNLQYDSGWMSNATETLKENWCDLHLALPKLSGQCNEYDIVAWLSTMAFAESADMCAVQAFAAFYRFGSMASVRPPMAPAFHLSNGSIWNHREIETIIRNSAKSFDDSSEASIAKLNSETNREHHKRIHALFQARRDGVVQTFVAEVKRQWPVKTPTPPNLAAISQYINVSDAMSPIKAKFTTWFHNRQFLAYLQETSALVAQQRASPFTSPRLVYSKPLPCYKRDDAQLIFHIDNIFAAAPPVVLREDTSHSTLSALVPPCEPGFPTKEAHESSHGDIQDTRLERLCTTLHSLAKSKCESNYVDALRDSCVSLAALHASDSGLPDAWLGDDTIRDLLQEYLHNCRRYFKAFNMALQQVVANSGSLGDRVGMLLQHSPRISPTFWLAQLHRDRFYTLSESWKTTIIEYGLAVTQLHRAQRLIALVDKPADLMEELGHVGHSNWDPRDFPETLLLEAESGILIRREQEFIASHMRTSQDAINIVLQLLMGGGKSSTIVPMVAAYLTDRKKLVRIIVAKPQSKQMLHMLISKLGYLLNRRVYHMPFSRSLRPTVTEAALIRQTYEECIANRGVLLIQPEHILSFKLMAVEALLAGQHCAQELLDTQDFFDRVSRDIVDESDENFSVKFELIYTMGTQRPIEFAPERWRIIQSIVGLIPRFARQVKRGVPDAIEVERDEAGRFPRVRILRNDAAKDLMLLLARHIVEYGIVGLPTNTQSPDVQAALLRYITESDLTASEIASVEHSRFWTESTKSPLLLVRGLIAGGILQFALSTKRWRVNYGLDPSRTPETQLAVPFRSKDCPSPRSEFSHPDVVILLSLLSHYYGGLTDEQLFDSFAHLLKSDQGNIQYDEWVSTASQELPSAFRQLSGVSIKDPHQCTVELFPFLRHSRKAIDYYLSFLVFPKAMKEFPQKLSASGWDIGAVKTNPVTGFSGTNDTLHLLPLAVKHLHLANQNHTNALVLRYLLQDETSVELLPPRAIGTGSDADHLLALVVQMNPEVRVILDCGASILEQNNQQVATAWLDMHDNDQIQAVVFFNDEELSVLDRAGRIEPLQTSPFAKDLGVCLVYLDEAHTRGTDLKLPRHYRAAVTLGQGLVKDKLTQGCMRMRKLGLGQSVAFIVPEEISTKIRERTGKSPDLAIEVSDVLCWSITETWQDLKRSMPLWAVQGERFERHKNLLCGVATTQAHAQAFLEDEAQTLEVRYKPLTQGEDSLGMLKTWDLHNANIAKIVTRCREFEAMGFGAATLSEEQERELAPEIEEERQIERPARLEPENHTIHPDVQHLVRTGHLRISSRVFKPAFQALATTSAAIMFPLEQFPADLLVTEDFERTVKVPHGPLSLTFISDSYHRPVQFILSVQHAPTGAIKNLVVISPVEANLLLDLIRSEAKVTLHIFAPRANASFDSLDRLELYNLGHDFTPDQVPRSLTMQLNLFAGSLYLRSFQEYTELCDFLGLLRKKPVQGQQVYADGFIDPPAGHWGLRRSPVPFLRTLLMKIRREGEGVEKTHLGRILNGVRLEESDFATDVEMSGT